MPARKLKTFLEVFEWNGPTATTTSVYKVEKRTPRKQKVESYVFGFRYFDAKSARSTRQKVSHSYFIKGKVFDIKEIPDSKIPKSDEILVAMVKRGIGKVVMIMDDLIVPFEKGDVLLNEIK